ncbi:MAG: phosphotransferase, partial [Planctomycetota bacterium]
MSSSPLELLATIKEEKFTSVELVCADTRRLVRKCYRAQPKFFWRTFLLRSKGHREYSNLLWLASLGIPAVRGYGWCETRSFGCVRQSWVFSEYEEGRTLYQLLDEGLDWRRRRKLAQSYGEILGQLHRAGFLSLTFQPRNLLVDAEDRLQLIDQPALSKKSRSILAGVRARVDLYDAAFSPRRRQAFSSSERMRLVSSYAGGDRRISRRIWRKLSSRKRWHHKLLRIVFALHGVLQSGLRRVLLIPNGNLPRKAGQLPVDRWGAVLS